MTKIGVILNQEEQITSLMEGSKVAIYKKVDQSWVKTCEITECFSGRSSMGQMRVFLGQLIAELQDCKVLVASILTGIPFMILDKEGFMLCEAEELTEQLFEEIAFDYEKMKIDKEQATKTPLEDYPTKPFETTESGIFELDMRKLQECHPEMSSKMALIPFLKEVKFYKLLVYCNHVMPWLDRELPVLGYTYQSSRLEDQGYLVEIEKTCCDCF